jgi:hypothetical protein
MSIIIRTAGSGKSDEEIQRDQEYLIRLWNGIRELTLKSEAPQFIYEEGSLIKRAMRDYEKYNLEAYNLKFIPVYLPPGVDPDDFLINGGKRNMVDTLRTAKEDCGFNV